MINKLTHPFRTLRRSPGGFTLIEALTSILILAMAITGPLTIAGKGLTAALIAKDQIVASYLAQDGAEYVRFLRDTACLASSSSCSSSQWLTGLAPCTSSNGTAACYVDSLAQNPASPQSCGGADCAAYPLYWDAARGLYTYSTTGTQKSIYTRTILITTPVAGNSDEALLTVTVQWKDVGNIMRSVTVQENMLDWQ